jgi:hypothetical protein
MVNCVHCQKETTNKKYCSRICKSSFSKGKTFEEMFGEAKAAEMKLNLSIVNSGENNPNFNNKWSDEQKKHGSEISKQRFESEEMRFKAGSANRGVKFTEERIAAMHGHRTKESYSRPMKEETKVLVGIGSKKKIHRKI